MFKLKRNMLILLLAVVLSACASTPVPNDPPMVMDTPRHTWEAHDIKHYRFNLNIGCFCAFRDQMPLTIEVQDGQVISMTAANNADLANFQEYFDQVNTVEKLFDKLASAQQEADSVNVEYDATYGFPTSISIDYMKDAVDDEVGYTVTNFEVLK